MKQKPKGYVLIITLTTILIVNLLLLTNMQLLLLYYKATNQMETRHHYFYRLEEIALQLAHSNLAKKKDCLRQDEGANSALSKLSRHEGCAINDVQDDYQYLIEDLGEYPCLTVGDKNAGSHHFRVSVWLVANEEHSASFLQLRYIKPGLGSNCPNQGHPIKSGVTSWRYRAVV